MGRYLLFFGCVLLGVFPCKSQDVIVLHKENKLTGRVLWEKSKGDSLFYRSAVSSGDSLLLFVPRRRVEYVLSDGDRRMLYRGKTRGWQPWRGRTFNEVPQHRMLYAASWSTILDGWSVEASAMRYLNRSNFFGIGGFVRYAETNPFRKDVGMKNTTLGYSYDNRAVSLGGQAEFRGYLRRLKTYGYLQLASVVPITGSPVGSMPGGKMFISVRTTTISGRSTTNISGRTIPNPNRVHVSL